MHNFCPTMKETYQDIVAGSEPWVALGNFLNAWFEYAREQRPGLIQEAIHLPASPSLEARQWAAYCAASVEYLSQKYAVPCPEWVHDPCYVLAERWFSTFGAHKPEICERLIQQTPEPFLRRNIVAGNRMFLNKYELPALHTV